MMRRASIGLAGLASLATLAGGFVLGRATSRPIEAARGDAATGEPTTPTAARTGTTSPLARLPDAKGPPSTEITIDLADWPGLAGGSAWPQHFIALWPRLLEQYGGWGRTEAAIAIARAAVARGASAAEIEGALPLGRPATALAVFEALRADGIDIPRAKGRVDVLLALAGRGAEAAAGGLETLAVADAVVPGGYVALAKSLIENGLDVPAALRVAESTPWNAWRLDGVAVALTALGRTEDAAAWSAAARRVAKIQLAGAARAEADAVASSLAQARAKATEKPQEAASWRWLADALRSVQDFAGAADAYERALEVSPFDTDAAEGLGRTDPERALKRVSDRWKNGATDEEIVLLARLHLWAGHLREAAEMVFRAREMGSIEDWLDAGISAHAPERAVAVLGPWLERERRSHVLVRGKAEALAALGRRDESRSLVFDAYGDNPAAEYQSLMIELDPVASTATFQERWATQPDHATQLALAQARMRRGDRDAALDGFRAYFAAGNTWPSDEPAAWIAAADPDAWMPVLRRAAEKDVEARVSLGRALEALGKRAEAIAAYESVLRDDRDQLVALIRLAALR